MFLFILTRVKEVIDSLGGMEIYGSPLANRVNISQLLTHVMVHYGVSPLFKVIVLPRGKIGVSILIKTWSSTRNALSISKGSGQSVRMDQHAKDFAVFTMQMKTLTKI